MLVGAEALPATALHEAFVDAFSDYLIGPFALGLEAWPGFLARQCAELPLSRAVLDESGRVLAFALVAPRQRRWRLATMGATPAARGSGAAAALLDDFIARAVAAGKAEVELEVFEQNERALRLYRSRGFETRHALYGYAHAGRAGPAEDPGIADLERGDALAWLEALAIDDLPLQLGARVLGVNPRPWRVWRSGSAQLVFDLQAERVQLLNLIDSAPAQQHAEGLVAALMRAYPGLPLAMPQLQRQDLGGAALERLGFERLALNQLLMVRCLRD